VRAPAAGRLESLVVSPGSVVGVGSVLAQVVPEKAPRTIVAFLPAKEIAFVRDGGLATIELESLSVGEFGTTKARITRVSTDVATADEVTAALGEALPAPVVRVELSLLDDAIGERMRGHLRSGERVTARLHVRKRRVLGLLFDFVRRWVS
jgi:pyruvate/2-oxoglutarate dehydrogenase complex dihydrolipoamide acyltransferase (E2) component